MQKVLKPCNLIEASVSFLAALCTLFILRALLRSCDIPDKGDK